MDWVLFGCYLVVAALACTVVGYIAFHDGKSKGWREGKDAGDRVVGSLKKQLKDQAEAQSLLIARAFHDGQSHALRDASAMIQDELAKVNNAH